jgi:hypothetical protein
MISTVCGHITMQREMRPNVKEFFEREKRMFYLFQALSPAELAIDKMITAMQDGRAITPADDDHVHRMIRMAEALAPGCTQPSAPASATASGQ